MKMQRLQKKSKAGKTGANPFRNHKIEADALQITPHTCNSPQGKHYTSCDRGGKGLSTKYANPG